MEKILFGVFCELFFCIVQNIFVCEIFDVDFVCNVIVKGIDEDVLWLVGEIEFVVGGLVEVGKNFVEYEVIIVKFIDVVDEEIVLDVEVLILFEMVQGFGKFMGCLFGVLLFGLFGIGLFLVKGISGRDEVGIGVEDFVEEGFEEIFVGFLYVCVGCLEVVFCGQEFEWFGLFFEYGLGCFVVGGEFYQG